MSAGAGAAEPVLVDVDASAVAEGTAVRVEVDGEPVCLARAGGRLYALRDVCSHADVALSEGEVDLDGPRGPSVECWLHGSRFDLATGRPSGLPATRPVPVYTVTEDGEDVRVALAPPPAPSQEAE